MSLQRLLRHIRNSFLNLGRTLSQWLSHFLRRGLGGLFRVGQGRQAGFVLPTVTMVMLVVSLLTLAMLLRSTDRGKNAQNFRVNEATLNAAAPALDRAKAKIDKLFSDPALAGRGTPSDDALLEVFAGSINTTYTFGDETPLVLVSNADKDTKIGVEDTEDQDKKDGKISRERPESLVTAWKFPVDTNNNGKFDTFTLYAIYLANSPGEEERPRYPLEARTSPMSEGQKPSRCQTSVVTSASKVGTSGWLKIDNKLKKSINVYAANVPITSLNDTNGTKVLDEKLYEEFQGAGGFSAIEYQQDRSRIPLANNAVVYEDDLEILPGAGLELNGRAFTNGSLLIGDRGETVRLWLVSSPDSCFYEEEISKVLVGGNLANGQVNDTNDTKPALIDLFQGKGTAPATNKNLGRSEKTITASGGSRVASNTFAYQERIDYMVKAAVLLGTWETNGKKGEEFKITKFPEYTVGPPATGEQRIPQGVINSIEGKMQANADLVFEEVRDQELEVYFRQRTRRVPYGEVLAGESALFVNKTNLDPIDTKAKAEAFFGMDRTGEPDTTGLDPLRPPNRWMYPVDPADNLITYMKPTSGTGLVLDVDNPKASDPTLRNGKEHLAGDRVLVGNNLPEYVYNQRTQEFTKNGEQDLQKTDNKWFTTDGSRATANIRARTSQVTTLTELGATDRDGFWELAAAKAPQDPKIDTVGGLRVVTGVGLYLPSKSGLPITPSQIPSFSGVNSSGSEATKWQDAVPESWPIDHTVWPDSMPVPKGNENIYDEVGQPIGGTSGTSKHPYLQMRATAVYHYDKDPSGDKGDPYDPNDPIDPSGEHYQEPIACVSSYYDPTDLSSNTKNSDNGVVYAWPGNKWSEYGLYLEYQAKLRFPNGNWVNPILHELDGPDKKMPNSTAWTTGGVKSGQKLTLSEKTAIDTAFCAAYILSGSANKDSSLIDDRTIYETAFLDAREIKAIEADDEALGTKSSDTGKLYEPSNYDLPIERRQPLEIRATVLDLEKMRKKKFGSATPTQEYLFPNSGIIYATREDAVPDNSVQGNKALSSKDSVLDPYRRPNAIMLVNGKDLSRETDYRLEERGLILATNLPVYIKGNFNEHSKQGEFTTGTHLDYSRTADKLNPNFACRKGQFPTCTDGESWRPATVIADAVTLLSSNFQEGFRSDGDYDLRMNWDAPAKWWKNPSDIAYEFNGVKYTENSQDFAPVGAILGFDANFNGTISASETASEESPIDLTATTPKYGIDLNGDGDTSDKEVKETEIVFLPPVSLVFDIDKNGEFDADDPEDSKFKFKEVSLTNPMNLTASPPEYPIDLDGSTTTLLDFNKNNIKTIKNPYPFLDIRGLRRLNGFFDNSFVTSRSFTDSTYSGTYAATSYDNSLKGQKEKPLENRFQSSYFNNFVTPIQRRATFPEYLMEMCVKLPVSACGPDDWYIIGYDANGKEDTPGVFVSEEAVKETNETDPWIDWDGDDGTVETEIKEKYAIDLNGNGNKTDTVSESKIVIDIDLNGNGNTTDIDVKESAIAIDLNGDGDTDDSVSELDLGIDLNGNGNTTDIDVKESAIAIDLNGDKDTIDTDVKESSEIKLDLNGNGNTTDTKFNELDFGIDLNGDGETNNTDVSIKEDNLPIIDWDGNGSINNTKRDFNGDGDFGDTVKEVEIMLHANDLGLSGMNLNRIGTISGTTAKDINCKDYPRYCNKPRRVAFLRNQDNTLKLDQNKTPILFGIDNNGNAIEKDDTVEYVGFTGGFILWTVDRKYFDCIANTNIIKTILFKKNPLHAILIHKALNIPSKTTVVSDSQGVPFPGISNSSTDRNKRQRSNALWFKTTTSATDPTSNGYYGVDTSRTAKGLFYLNPLTGTIPGEQPLLVPVLQLQVTSGDPKNTSNFKADVAYQSNSDTNGNTTARRTNWMQHATTSAEFNLVMTAGDTPGRPQDQNGGLGNYPRFLESWRNQNGRDDNPTKMLGSFIQLARSAYGDAPFATLMDDNNGIFKKEDAGDFKYYQFYAIDSGEGLVPYYSPPARNWGFDVALLTQQPDLFSQQFTMPPTADPNEFFRQVNRDDDWVQTLLCAAQAKDTVGGFDNATSAYGKDYKYAIPKDQMPGTCPFSP